MSEFSYAPLSMEQERLWVLARIHGAVPAFHARGAAWLDGELDVPTLIRAIEALAARHEVLRTSLTERAGQPVQVISPAVEIALREVDLGANGHPTSEEEALAAAREEVSLPFDVERGPLWRVCLVRVHQKCHLIALSMHHLISDGDRSVDLFFSELFASYHGTELPALPMRYQDYARRQLGHGADGLLEKQLDHWRRELAGAPAALEVRTDRPRPAVQTFAGGSVERALDQELFQELRALARDEDAELSAVLLAGMHAVLHRYTGQDDILIGTRLSGREHPDLRGIVGHLGNPVVVRGRLGVDPSFRSLLHQVHQSLQEGRANGDLSFTSLVEKLSPPLDPSRTPLFQVLFCDRMPRKEPRRGPLLTLTPADIALPYVAYDLVVLVQEAGAGMVARIEYNRDLFDQATIARLLGHWEVLLRGAVRAPGQRVSELPLLTEEESRKLLFEWNTITVSDPPRDRIHERVEAQAQRTPSAVAVVFEQQRLTYAELDRRSNQIAHLLRASGVGPDIPVGLCMERSLEMIVALLGILKAGGAYVPLNPTYPADRLAFMLEDARIPVLLTEESVASRLQIDSVRVVRLDADRAMIEEQPRDKVLPASGEGPENLAYILYTSGSTGKPKGVMVNHHNVVRLFDNIVGWYRFSDVDVWTMFHSYAFDFSVLEIWGALFYGGRLVVVPYLTSRTPDAFYKLLCDEGVTILSQTPSAFRQLIHAEETLDPEAMDRLKLRLVICGGEALDVAALRPWWERHGDEVPTIVNIYGPTETTVFVTYRPVGLSDLERPWSSLIGRAVPDVRVLILDRNRALVPVGVPGEIYVGGAGVSRGYLNRPELTRDRFIRDPFSADPDARLYKTGDVARYLPSGEIEYVGRSDDQVKIRGHRIELGEITAVLGQHPDVREAVVVAREDSPGEKRLVAYVVPHLIQGSAAREENALIPALRAFLQSSLPSYMVPSAFVQLAALPTTTNGKVDRRALPMPGGARPELGRAFVAPRSELEQTLASIWRELLRLERVGVHDSFFELGGSSLKTVQLFSRVRGMFGIDIKFQEFFSDPTIVDLATLVRKARTASSTSGISNISGSEQVIPAVPRHGPLPLSFAQERMWFLYRLTPDSRAYNCLYSFHLTGSINVAALDRSLRELVRRHEILRTTYSENEGRPVQIIAPDTAIRLDVADLQHLSPEEREAEVHQRIDAEAQRIFDLERGPVIRAGLLKSGPDDHILWFHFHHIAIDGWSIEVAYREIAALYNAFCMDAPSPLPDVPIQYADFAVWQREQLKEGALSELLAWWKGKLLDVPPLLELPSDHVRPAVQSFRGSTLSFKLEPSVAKAIRGLSVRKDMTLNMVLLAVYAVLLHRYTHCDDILIGMPSANRDRADLEQTIGFFVNAIPIRVDLSGDPSFEELLHQVRQVCLEAYEHDMLPFERLVQELRPERNPSYNPVVQIVFAPQPPAEREINLAGLESRYLDADAKKTIFDVALYSWENSWENAGGVDGMLEYSTDLFERPTMDRMVDHLLALLSAVASDPSRPVSSLPMLTAPEQHRILVEWNDTDADFPRDRSVLDLFEDQVMRAPHAVAVVSDRGSLTYGELARRANQLAHRLRELGVGAATWVGICAERSLEMVVGILGVLKAGAAYIPFDVEYPRDRLEFILKDSGVPVLLTQAHLVERLPAFTGEVIRLDADRPTLAGRSEAPPPVCPGPADVAYAIYTSGSTGRPKGVLVEHRGLMNLVAWHVRRFSISSADRATLLASPGFDASVWELWPYLCAGASLYIPGETLRRSPSELKEWLLEQGITVSFLPTPIAEELLRLDWPADCALRCLLTGGDKLRVWPHAAVPFDVVNNYGPTEGTVVATSCSVPKSPMNSAAATLDPSIGGPIDNTRVYILDPHLRIVPVGVSGELYIGGVGIARGYLNRPELTAERFLPDMFSGEPGARMYRTGDLARWLPDGNIEFLGRVDHQVKIRGYRIELAEVEAVLREHPTVEEAVVLAREDTPGNKRLVAYVVPSLHGGGALEQDPVLRAEHVSAWRALYDGTYGDDAGVDPSFNITGWNSSYTGKPIEPSAMRAWRDNTVERILSFQPDRMWEIGCGTGLLLLQLAPQCAVHLGTDFSEQAISLLRPQLAAGTLSHVSLQQREANDFSGIDAGSFDVIVLNSIVQYFPDVNYLHSVLQGAVRSVAPGGVVFVGDVRSLPLLEAFHTSAQLHEASPETTAAELRARVHRAVGSEAELVLSPDYFHALSSRIPGVAHVEIWLKRGWSSDEMTRFRYDVVLYVGVAPEPAPIVESLDWAATREVAHIERSLREQRPVGLEVLGITNARVNADVIASSKLREATGTAPALSATTDAGAPVAIDPEVLWELGARLGYSVRITWSRTGGPGCMDVLFERSEPTPRPRAWLQARAGASQSITALANNPLRGKQTRAVIPALRDFLAAKLPAYMVPAAIVKLDALPLTANGKVDRRALPAPDGANPRRKEAAPAPASDVEAILSDVWRKVLDLDQVGLDDPFFELGGHSLLLAQVRAGIRAQLGRDVPMVDLFQYPTIRSLSAHLRAGPLAAPMGTGSAFTALTHASSPRAEAPARGEIPEGAIAIVGMAGRFPKARNIEELWFNLRNGIEGISFYTPEELRVSGVAPEVIRAPSYVPAAGVLEDAMCFDASFFGYGPQEAAIMDPQHRVFLECAWEAMESAGYNPFTYPKPVGVFAGSDAPSYWIERIGLAAPPMSVEHYQIYTGNVTDCLTTRVAYKLGLRGPAVTVMTACSTSLVAVHMGCQSLLAKECDMVLAGGVVVLSPRRFGHIYEEGSVTSPDGHCRPFDADASGIVAGSGVGLVVLKRLKDALDDGDTIHAVLRGSAIGNDGSLKVGYTAPSQEGQSETIARAHAAAGVSPDSISYVEAHGTGTRLGDPIEVAALSRVFRLGTERVGFCALGSIKSNIGHLGAAAGVTGLIKAVLSLEHALIPPTLHFRSPNPEIDLASSPFFVNAEPIAWKRGSSPRRAAVSAFGIGGTNAHVVLEEAPELESSGPSRSCHLLVISARTSTALEESTDRLAEHLRRTPEVSLPDVAFTLQQGRVPFAHRRAVVCLDPAAAAASLQERDSVHVVNGITGRQAPKVVFMFPGGGTQRVGMGRELYLHERVYRENMDRCAELFQRELSVDIRTLLFAEEQERTRAEEELLRPSLNVAVIFSTEHALAQLLLSWGIHPVALTGHSIGEYAAACMAGVLSLEDAVALVALRGRLYEELPRDAATLIVPLSEDALVRRLGEGLSLAAVNGPEACVVSGTGAAIERLEAELQREGCNARRLPIAAAAHSSLVEPLMDRLTRRAATMERRSPGIPIVSNLTGEWMTASEAKDPSYWARHLRGTVRFADGLTRLLEGQDCILLEVGPGRTLATLASRHPDAGAGRLIASTMVSPGSDRTDVETLLAAVGQLWCAGVEIEWTAMSREQRRRRVPLPTYPFERISHVLDSTSVVGPATVRSSPSSKLWKQPDSSAVQTLPKDGGAALRQGMVQHGDHVSWTLASLFRELLGVSNVRPHDNFFDLGGNSLVSVRLRARIQERLNVSLPVHAFLESRTFAALVERIRESMPPDSLAPMSVSTTQRSGKLAGKEDRNAGRQLLVKFQEGAPGNTPLFLIQPIGGTVYTYDPLVQRLSGELPVYGVRASGMEPNEPIFTDIPTMAARYLEAIMTIRPEGPYLLGGHSAGGVIAYEMAQQLLAQGHNVPLVLMMDTGSIPAARPIRLESIADLTREMSGFEEIASQGYRSFMAALQDDTPFRAIVLSTWQALMAYTPRPTQANLLYLRAREQVGARDAQALDYWMELARGPFAFHKVPGNHFSMMDPPHVAFAARVLQQHLAPVNRSRIKLAEARDGKEVMSRRAPLSSREIMPESSRSH